MPGWHSPPVFLSTETLILVSFLAVKFQIFWQISPFWFPWQLMFFSDLKTSTLFQRGDYIQILDSPSPIYKLGRVNNRIGYFHDSMVEAIPDPSPVGYLPGCSAMGSIHHRREKQTRGTVRRSQPKTVDDLLQRLGLEVVKCFIIPPRKLCLLGDILFSCCPSIRLSVRPSVTFWFFFNILKRQWWQFIKFCRHIDIDKMYVYNRKLRARGQFCWSYCPL